LIGAYFEIIEVRLSLEFAKMLRPSGYPVSKRVHREGILLTICFCRSPFICIECCWRETQQQNRHQHWMRRSSRPHSHGLLPTVLLRTRPKQWPRPTARGAADLLTSVAGTIASLGCGTLWRTCSAECRLAPVHSGWIRPVPALTG